MLNVDKEKGLVLSEIADGCTVEDVQKATGCKFEVCFTSVILSYTLMVVNISYTIKLGKLKLNLMESLIDESIYHNKLERDSKLVLVHHLISQREN